MSRSKKYTALIDIDTLIIHAALAGQKSKVIATHKETGWSKEFKNQTEFFGHHSKKEGGWLAELNQKREVKVSADAFNIETITELVDDEFSEAGKVITAEAVSKGRFKSKIEAIVNQDWCSEFKICFGTGKSFRYDIAQLEPYKSKRPDKPLMYEAVRDYMLTKYAKHIISYDGVESDEILTQELYRDWVKAGGDFDRLTVVSCHIDKDINQLPLIHYNFDKADLGLVRLDQLSADKNFAIQCLMGDGIDTIPGLPKLSDEVFVKYGLRKTKGVGEATAKGVVATADTSQEVFERLVEVYKACYGEDKQSVQSFRGYEMQWNWLDHLNERFRLLRMRTDVTQDVGHVNEFLESRGVKV